MITLSVYILYINFLHNRDLRQHNDNQEIITPSINHDDYTRANIRRVKKRNAKRRKR